MFKKSIVFNLFIMLLLSLGLLFVFFSSLDFITNHGQETIVPKLTGKKLKESIKELEAQHFNVQIDSVYMPYIDPLQVVFQEPEAGMNVKVGRTLFLTVNKKSPPMVSMPNLVSKSFRNAVLILQSYRMVVGDTIFRPDIAAGAILEQLWNGKKINPGTMLPYGSKIDLVVGEGLAQEEIDVPNLIGKSWMEAKTILTNSNLMFTVICDGNITDTMSAIVYQQFPESLNELDFIQTIHGGDMIDVRVMQNPSQTLLKQNLPGSAKYQNEDDTSLNQSIERIAPKREPRDSNARRNIPGMGSPSVLGDQDASKVTKKTNSTTSSNYKKLNNKKGSGNVNTSNKSKEKAPSDDNKVKSKSQENYSDQYD